MHIRATSLAILLGVISLPMFGQAAAVAGADVSASPDDIKKLFDVMQIRDQMKMIMEQVYQQMRDMERDQVKNQRPDATDDDFAKLDAISEQVLRGMSVEGLLDDMIPVYQKHLSKADVAAMIGFYSTATGQKILREMPAMTTEGMQAMQPRLRKMVDDANAQIEKMVREQLQEKKDDHGKPGTVKN
jgi:uncharacterized protein